MTVHGGVDHGGGAASAAARAVSRRTRWVDDFPTAGVRFADLTPVFADGPAFRSVIDALVTAGAGADLVAGVDARGFLLGGAMAMVLDTGVLAVRKAGKLPPPVRTREYALEYGTASLEIGASVELHGRRIVVVDDVLATGGTLAATVDLLTAAGAEVVGAVVVLEIEALDGRSRLGNYPLMSLVRV